MATKAQHRSGLLAGTLLLSLTTASGAVAATGEELFIKRCAGCHMIGAGQLVGPDLKDVAKRRSEEWLLRFMKSPKAMFESGDAEAVALIKAYDVLMPDQILSEVEARDVLAFIAARSAPAQAAAAPAPVEPPPVAPAPTAAAGEVPPPAPEQDAGPPPWLVAPLVAALALTAWTLVRPKRKPG